MSRGRRVDQEGEARDCWFEHKNGFAPRYEGEGTAVLVA